MSIFVAPSLLFVAALAAARPSLAAVQAAGGAVQGDAAAGSEVDAASLEFNRDIRPILSNHCFECHGPDKGSREARLRLDLFEEATADRKRGAALVPGDAAGSLMIARITHADPEERMPPPEKHNALDERELALLRAWIDAGAEWQDHWSFTPLQERPVPAVEDDFVRNEVDRWLLNDWSRAGFAPSAPADARTLIRRLYFDLTGLPPTDEVVRAYAEDPSDEHYERIVDELLASEAHAERLTVYWLDLVRYADSVGIHGDQPMSVSPYRDWVIEAFHANMPFDRFTREQLAGDLLSSPTLDQLIASGYNRLNRKTAEAGAQAAEYLVKYAADRVRTTSTVWLGATLGCAECHDHKYDPFTTRDFYRFSAFFADLDEQGVYPRASWRPKLAVPTEVQAAELERLRGEFESQQLEYQRETPELASAREEWEAAERAKLDSPKPPTLSSWQTIGPFQLGVQLVAHEEVFAPELPGQRRPTPDGDLAWTERPDWADGEFHELEGFDASTYLYRELESPLEQPIELAFGAVNAIKVWQDEQLVHSKFLRERDNAHDERVTLTLKSGTNRLLVKLTTVDQRDGFQFRVARIGPPERVVAGLRTPSQQRTRGQAESVDAYFRSVAPELAELRAEIEATKRAYRKLEDQQTTTLISRSLPEPRTTRVLARGDWQDETGAIVRPGVPAFLTGGERESESDRPRLTRLDLADWLVSEENPLTARVFVNRLWKLTFGRGLSVRLDDLGTQGEQPLHLELLDWLAAEFRRDWNVRRMLRLLVTSSAYRMDSEVSNELLERDPENRQFSRQGRFRLEAEFVRDQALFVSGLLNREVGGPSVKPYQPEGHWAQLAFPQREWEADSGPAQYRRGLYTHWQRSFLHPSLRAFDAPPREECTAERARSNTPLQALVLLNDPTYVEAARVLAGRVLDAPGELFEERLDWLFAEVLTRRPTEREAELLETLWSEQHASYLAHPERARELIATGQAPIHESEDPVELAAWTAVTRVLLNLHETITRY